MPYAHCIAFSTHVNSCSCFKFARYGFFPVTFLWHDAVQVLSLWPTRSFSGLGIIWPTIAVKLVQAPCYMPWIIEEIYNHGPCLIWIKIFTTGWTDMDILWIYRLCLQTCLHFEFSDQNLKGRTHFSKPQALVSSNHSAVDFWSLNEYMWNKCKSISQHYNNFYFFFET